MAQGKEFLQVLAAHHELDSRATAREVVMR